jgi:hypothetical protein
MRAPIAWRQVTDLMLLTLQTTGLSWGPCHSWHTFFVFMVLPIFYDNVPLLV